MRHAVPGSGPYAELGCVTVQGAGGGDHDEWWVSEWVESSVIAARAQIE